MNILIINHYAGSPVHGMEHRHYYLAKNFIGRGHRVDIVAASYSHLRSKPPDTRGSLSQEVIDNIRYWWLRTTRYEGNGTLRTFNMLQFGAMLLAKKRILSNECHPHIVIVSSPHPFAVFGAASIARACKAKLIFEVRDLWPLTLTEIGGISANHPFVRFMQWTEDYAYHRADYVISLLPKAQEYMVKHGMRPEKFLYVPNGIDTEEWETDGGESDGKVCEKIIRFKDSGFFVVGYTGAHGIANELHTLIGAAAQLQSEAVRFVLVGNGPEKEALQKRVKNSGIKNVLFLSAVPKSDMPRLLGTMDVLYIGLKREPLFRFGISPNKLMDYMMAAKPIIHAIEAGNDTVTDCGCGISVPPEDPDAVSSAVKSMMAMTQDERSNLGLRGRRYVMEHHNYRILARNIIEAVS